MSFPYDFTGIFLLLSLVVLPVTYLILCIWMKRAVPKPPIGPFFFIFGTIGGYFLLLSLGPYNSLFATPLVFGSFFLAAFIAILLSFFASLRAKRNTKFHKASAATSGVLVLLMIWCTVSPNCGGLSYAGRWDDDPANWRRAMHGQPQPSEMHIMHSRYWRSPHFTYEAGYYFKFTAPEKYLQAWFDFQKLTSATPIQENTASPYQDRPSWFIPKPLDSYEMWMPADIQNDHFRIYRDRSDGTLYVTDFQ